MTQTTQARIVDGELTVENKPRIKLADAPTPADKKVARQLIQGFRKVDGAATKLRAIMQVLNQVQFPPEAKSCQASLKKAIRTIDRAESDLITAAECMAINASGFEE